jgi:hypothetical protein
MNQKSLPIDIRKLFLSTYNSKLELHRRMNVYGTKDADGKNPDVYLYFTARSPEKLKIVNLKAKIKLWRSEIQSVSAKQSSIPFSQPLGYLLNIINRTDTCVQHRTKPTPNSTDPVCVTGGSDSEWVCE